MVVIRFKKKLKREGLMHSCSYIGLLMEKIRLTSSLKRKLVVVIDFSQKFREKRVSNINYIRINNDWSYLTTIIHLLTVMNGREVKTNIKNTLMKALIDARKTRNMSESFIYITKKRRYT